MKKHCYLYTTATLMNEIFLNFYHDVPSMKIQFLYTVSSITIPYWKQREQLLGFNFEDKMTQITTNPNLICHATLHPKRNVFTLDL